MARKIEIDVIGNSASAESALNRIGGASDKLSSKLGGVLKTAAIGGAAALGAGFAATIGIGVKSLIEHEKAAAQTGAVIKSTGGVAKVSAAEVASLADAIEKKSGIDDVAVISGENLLLTFTKVKNEAGEGNDIFAQATSLMADMSVAMGTDMTSSAMLLGKALNDPEKGMTALTKAGVQFTEEQKKQIAGMIESGDLMGAQKIILAELTTQFGGSAEALGGTVAGKINILKARFEEVAEALASKLMPYAERFIDWLMNIDENETAQGVIEGVKGALSTLGGVVKEVGGFFADHEGAAKAFGIALAGVATASVGFKVIPGLDSMAGSLVKIAATSFGPWGIAVAGAAVGIGALAVGLSSVIDSGPTLSDVLDDMAEKAGFLSENLQSVADAELELSGSHLAVERATISVTQAQNDLADAHEKVRNNVVNGKPAVDLLRDSELRLKEATLGLKTAQEAEAKASENATEKRQAQSHATLSLNKDLEDAAIKTTAFMGTYAGNKQTVITEFSAKMRDMAAAAGGVATQGGLTATVVADLTDKIKDVPSLKQIKIIEQGAAEGRTRAQLLKAAIDALSSKTITVSTNYISSGSYPGMFVGTNAEGTDNWRGGLSMVGEKGAELVNLPRGSQVIPADETRRMLAGGGGAPTIIVNIYGSVWQERDVGRSVRDAILAGLGTANPRVGLN